MVTIDDFNKILLCRVYGKDVIFSKDHSCQNCVLYDICKDVPEADEYVYLCIVRGKGNCSECNMRNECDDVLFYYLRSKGNFYNERILFIYNLYQNLKRNFDKYVEIIKNKENTENEGGEVYWKAVYEFVKRKVEK